MKFIVACLFIDRSPIELSFANKTSRESYQLLTKMGRERNIDLRFVLGEESKDSTFHSYWKFEGDELIFCEEQFSPARIWLRTRENKYEYLNRVNNAYLENVLRDKYLTAQIFPKYCKKTILVSKDSSVSDFTTDRVVIKPQFGSDGSEVEILAKEDYNAQKYIARDFIVQEFIDSEKGIPGLINKRHEMRMYVFNGEIKAAYLRVPASGSYLANIAQGAKEQQFALTDLPQSIFPLKDYVDAAFSSISARLYTIDIMFENKEPWIVELNDSPGMPDVSVQPLTNTFLQALLTLFETI